MSLALRWQYRGEAAFQDTRDPTVWYTQDLTDAIAVLIPCERRLTRVEITHHSQQYCKQRTQPTIHKSYHAAAPTIKTNTIQYNAKMLARPRLSTWQQAELAANHIELKKGRHAKLHIPLKMRSDRHTIHKNSKAYEVVYNRDHPATWNCLKVEATTLAKEQKRAYCDSKFHLMPSEIDQAEQAGVSSEVVRDILAGWTDCNDTLCSGRCYLQQQMAAAKARKSSDDLITSKKQQLQASRRKPLEYIDLMMGSEAPDHIVDLVEDGYLVDQDEDEKPVTWSHFEGRWETCFDDRPSKRTQWEVEYERLAPDEHPKVTWAVEL